MAHLTLAVDKIKQKLSKIPDDKLIEVDDFIDFLLVKSQKPIPNIVKLEGIWEGLGFEKIQNLETNIKKIRKEISNSIMKRAL